MTDAAPDGRRRRAGLLIPLFSCTSTRSWGIGDIGDIEPLTAWLASAGQRVLQLLPINEMAPGQQSPYSAISAMAIDPIFICLPAVSEFAALGGEEAMSRDDRERLDAARRSSRVEYRVVRGLKDRALRAAFRRFNEHEYGRDTPRAAEFRRFISEQAWWVEDYSLFRAMHAREGEQAWPSWPEPLQRREPAAIDRARRELAGEVRFYQYLQWIAGAQWLQVRVRARSLGVELFGDLPFMVDRDSADVWARQHQFHLDVSLGVPPDAFSATGQDWGMPVYRWEVIAQEHFRWLRERARRSADLFDGYRIDHLVGFYRTYGRPRNGGAPFFTPPDEPSQTMLGETLLGIFRAPGAEIIAEDLGTVPDFVRASLERIGVPGFKVFRWERHWHADGQPFRDPGDYPVVSVATSGTHDTEPLAIWWNQADDDERQKVSALPTVQQIANRDIAATPFDETVRDVLLEALFASASYLLLLPLQDAFGWDERINQPATIGEHNWTYRLPWPVDRFDIVTEAQERGERLRLWAEKYRRV